MAINIGLEETALDGQALSGKVALGKGAGRAFGRGHRVVFARERRKGSRRELNATAEKRRRKKRFTRRRTQNGDPRSSPTWAQGRVERICRRDGAATARRRFQVNQRARLRARARRSRTIPAEQFDCR